jgi:hypothetical protein
MTSLKVDTRQVERNQFRMCIMCKIKKNQRFLYKNNMIILIGYKSYYEIVMEIVMEI